MPQASPGRQPVSAKPPTTKPSSRKSPHRYTRSTVITAESAPGAVIAPITSADPSAATASAPTMPSSQRLRGKLRTRSRTSSSIAT